MTYKTIIFSKALLAIFTLIRFLLGVSFDVPCKITIASKALLAVFALMRLNFGVSS